MEHLKKTKSKLAKQVLKRGVMEVLGDMQLLIGPPEQRYLSNVALMMFCEHLDQFFPYTQVEIIKFPEGSIRNPNNFIEIPLIKGSVPEMIKRTMEKLQDMAIYDNFTKVDYQMESIRCTSYPYAVLEEAVVNAFYHRDYLSNQPIIIEIEPELIRIISFPGIDCSISMNVIKEGKRFSSRYYRNKSLGEFLKELKLSEGKSTGIPTIQEELKKNGSPRAVFMTDEDRRAVTVEIPIHPVFLENKLIIEKSTDSNTKVPVESQKSTDSTKKVPIESEKSTDSTKKVPIESEKSTDSTSKVSFGKVERSDLKLKTIFSGLVEAMDCSEKVKDNIRLLYEQIGEDIFGRMEITNITKQSDSAAGKLIVRMKKVI